MDGPDLFTRGREALRNRSWAEAEAAFQAAVDAPSQFDPADALEGLAEVRCSRGDYASAIALRERAYAALRAGGDTRRAAKLAAYQLAFDHAAYFGNLSVAAGWLERGRSLAEAAGDCAESGWVELAGALFATDVDEKAGRVEAATAIARRFGDADLEFDALAYSGLALVEDGRVREGMRCLDESAAAARGGEVRSTAAVGEIYCKMLVACELALDVRRAQEWTDAAVGLGTAAGVEWAPAICRMHYGGILTAAGRWDDAERELSGSVSLFSTSYPALSGGAVVRLADLRARQGRLEEAEALVTEAAHDSYAVRPLARLHLARGELEPALSALRRHLVAHGEGVVQAPVLVLLAEAEAAAGRHDAAAARAERLAEIAEATGLPVLTGLAAYAAGCASAGRDERAAVGHFEAAQAALHAAGLPLEEAVARVALARVVAASTPDVAVAEARTALAALDRLGATLAADSAAALLRSLGSRGRVGPKNVGVLTVREREVLTLLARGLSNPEIAERLFISRKTAEHHVSNVLSKLGLRNRAEAAAFAASHPAGGPP